MLAFPVGAWSVHTQKNVENLRSCCPKDPKVVPLPLAPMRDSRAPNRTSDRLLEPINMRDASKLMRD